MTTSNHIFSACAFLGFLGVTIPLPWHLYSWNVGTVVYMFWTSLALLSFFVNSIIWDENAINWAPIWCDISTRIQIGAAVGIPAASLCINRRLYHIATTNTVTTTKAEKRRMIWIDLSVGLGLGLLAIPLQYVVQGHRFNIFEDVGCYPFTLNTPPAYVLVHLPPLLIGMVSAGYCVGSIWNFNKRRQTFNELLSSGNGNLNANRYWRLMALGAIEAVSTIPLALTLLIMNASVGPRPYISWASVHEGFSRVDQFPASQWKAMPESKHLIEMSRWLFVACAVVFFAFFGFADEARKNYRRAYFRVCKTFGYTPSSFGSTAGYYGPGSDGSGSRGTKKAGATGSIPRFDNDNRRKNSTAKRNRTDSLDSFSSDEASGSSFSEKGSRGAIVIPTTTASELSYGQLDLKDVGGLLDESTPSPTSPAVAYPEPVRTVSRDSVHRVSDSMSPV